MDRKLLARVALRPGKDHQPRWIRRRGLLRWRPAHQRVAPGTLPTHCRQRLPLRHRRRCPLGAMGRRLPGPPSSPRILWRNDRCHAGRHTGPVSRHQPVVRMRSHLCRRALDSRARPAALPGAGLLPRPSHRIHARHRLHPPPLPRLPPCPSRRHPRPCHAGLFHLVECGHRPLPFAPVSSTLGNVHRGDRRRSGARRFVGEAYRGEPPTKSLCAVASINGSPPSPSWPAPQSHPSALLPSPRASTSASPRCLSPRYAPSLPGLSPASTSPVVPPIRPPHLMESGAARDPPACTVQSACHNSKQSDPDHSAGPAMASHLRQNPNEERASSGSVPALQVLTSSHPVCGHPSHGRGPGRRIVMPAHLLDPVATSPASREAQQASAFNPHLDRTTSRVPNPGLSPSKHPDSPPWDRTLSAAGFPTGNPATRALIPSYLFFLSSPQIVRSFPKSLDLNAKMAPPVLHIIRAFGAQ